MTTDALDPRRMNTRRIVVAVVSDVRLYREGIAAALDRCDGLSVGGTASSLAEALDRVGSTKPDVVVVDMATRDSLAIVRGLATRLPGSRIVAVGVDEWDSGIVRCAEAGAAGYVPCEGSVDDLIVVIEGVFRDECPCSPHVAAALFRHIARLAQTGRPAGHTAGLSSREEEILALIRRGLSNKDIARALTIEVATVKNHVHSLLAKLGVTTRGEAAAHQAGSRSNRRIDPRLDPL